MRAKPGFAGAGACAGFGAVAFDACPETPTASAEAATEAPIHAATYFVLLTFYFSVLSSYFVSGFFRNAPYISSSTNSTHLKSINCAFFSSRRYSGMLIFHTREKTFGSSIVAS